MARIIKDAKNQDETPKFRLANMSDLPKKIPSEYSNTDILMQLFFGTYSKFESFHGILIRQTQVVGVLPAGGAAISLTTDQYLKLEFDELAY